MMPVVCEKCGHPAEGDVRTCSECGHAVKNGAIPDSGCPAKQLDGRQEKGNMTIYPVPSEVLDWARATFNEEDYLAALREIEKTGGRELKDFIHELEQGASPRE
jgi:hypothetical protein